MLRDSRIIGASALMVMFGQGMGLNGTQSIAAQVAQAQRASAVTSPPETQDLFWQEAAPPLSPEERRMVVSANCPSLADGFETQPSSAKWDIKRMNPRERFVIQSDKRREGQRALAISLFRDDQPNANGKHKHELWIANEVRCHFGTEVWYSFSFHIDGVYPEMGSTRWVIGQWKEETDGSPFLAQRFDNGVFHISVESDGKREIIATAPGDYSKVFLFASDEFRASLPFEEGAAPKPFDVMERAAEFGPGAFDIGALRQAIITQDIQQFPFVADPESYGKIEGLIVEPSDDPLLPNPTTDWVDMRYRVKGDRSGNGLVEVWANDRLVVRATGKIGNEEFGGPTKYFKIGHYRDLDNEFEHSRSILIASKEAKIGPRSTDKYSPRSHEVVRWLASCTVEWPRSAALLCAYAMS